MLLNWCVGEDSWESLGLQGDLTSPSWRRSVLGVHWKDWCWSWNSSTLATWCKELSHLKRPWCWEDWGREKGTTKDEMVGWHHWLNGHGFGWTLGVGDRQGGLECCRSWGRKESDTTERLNWKGYFTQAIYGSCPPRMREKNITRGTWVNKISLKYTLRTPDSTTGFN